MNKTITEDVGESVKIGLHVYDQDAERVGFVDQAYRASGWMEVASGELHHQRLWVPYRLIRSIDEREISLSATKGWLQEEHATPPVRYASPAQVAGRKVAIITEVSGYGSEPVRVHEVDIDHVKQLLAIDQRVWTSDDATLGWIKQFDATGHYLVIEQGALSFQHDLVVPVGLVAEVNQDALQAKLAVREADLNRMQMLEPLDVVIKLPMRS